MNWTRLLQIYFQVLAVSIVSLFVFSRLFDTPLLSVAVAAVVGIALVSLVFGGLLAGSVYLYYVFSTVWRKIFALAWPVMVEQSSRTLMRTTDVFVTALFSPAAVVAIGLSELYSQFPLRIGLGIGSATIALSSQDTGRGADADRDEATSQALLIGLFFGIPIAVVGVLFSDQLIAVFGAEPDVVELGSIYLAIILATAPARHVGLIGAKVLQGIGDTRTPMYINLVVNVLNVLGSVILGLGLLGAPELRIIGVGLSTATANVLGAVLFVAAIVGPWNPAGVTWPSNPIIGRQLVAVGLPQIAEGFIEAIARFPFNALLLIFGTEINAGYQIGKRIYQQITAPLARAYRVTASITTGQALGDGDGERARFEGWAVVALAVLSVGVIGVSLILMASPLAQLFTDDPETVNQAVWFIRTYGIAAVPYVIFITLSGSLQGASETRLPLIARTTGLFAFFLGFSYLAGVTAGYGPPGVYVGIILSYVWMAAFVIYSYIYSDWAARATEMIETRAESG